MTSTHDIRRYRSNDYSNNLPPAHNDFKALLLCKASVISDLNITSDLCEAQVVAGKSCSLTNDSPDLKKPPGDYDSVSQIPHPSYAHNTDVLG